MADQKASQSCSQIRGWSDRLYALLGEIEEANGPDLSAASKLENLVRYAWDEARDSATREEACVVPIEGGAWGGDSVVRLPDVDSLDD